MAYPELQAMSMSASHQIMSIVCPGSQQCYVQLFSININHSLNIPFF